MSCSLSKCKENIKDIAASLGFHSCGVASISIVDDDSLGLRNRWIADGMHATMSYMERYADIRRDPALLLDGARSIIMLAMSYYSEGIPPWIARYAVGDDYHETLRRLVAPITDCLASCGFTSRVCIDTAPLDERYWAVRAGVGFIGRNGMLILPDAGSYFFLVAVLTDAELTPDPPCTLSCRGCALCIKRCPGKAIKLDKRVDARRCISYLTIEHRGDFPEGTDLRGHIYGCDVCQEVCPHNACPPPTPLKEFLPRPDVISLTPERIRGLSQEEFSAIFTHSAVKRTKLAGLQRNASNLLKD